MPELPEVETVRRDLEKVVVGRKIKSVEVHPSGMRSIRRHRTRKGFSSRLDGRKITGVDRRGKYLIVKLDAPIGALTEADVLVVHLGMSGQLILATSAKEAAPRHTHVTFTLTPTGLLRFVDPRTFGELFVTTPDELIAEVPELGHLGFDPLEGVMSWIHFGELLHARKRRLKDLMMDQKFLAGIGNIYSDEILWAAGLRYDRPSDSLTSQEIRRLYRAMTETLQEAIKYRGSSLADEQYRDLFGEIGGFTAFHQVYNREGEHCRRCRKVISRIKVGGRSHFLCEKCQV